MAFVSFGIGFPELLAIIVLLGLPWLVGAAVFRFTPLGRMYEQRRGEPPKWLAKWVLGMVASAVVRGIYYAAQLLLVPPR